MKKSFESQDYKKVHFSNKISALQTFNLFRSKPEPFLSWIGIGENNNTTMLKPQEMPLLTQFSKQALLSTGENNNHKGSLTQRGKYSRTKNFDSTQLNSENKYDSFKNLKQFLLKENSITGEEGSIVDTYQLSTFSNKVRDTSKLIGRDMMEKQNIIRSMIVKDHDDQQESKAFRNISYINRGTLGYRKPSKNSTQDLRIPKKEDLENQVEQQNANYPKNLFEIEIILKSEGFKVPSGEFFQVWEDISKSKEEKIYLNKKNPYKNEHNNKRSRTTKKKNIDNLETSRDNLSAWNNRRNGSIASIDIIENNMDHQIKISNILELNKLRRNSERSDALNLIEWFNRVKSELDNLEFENFKEKFDKKGLLIAYCYREITKQIGMVWKEQGRAVETFYAYFLNFFAEISEFLQGFMTFIENKQITQINETREYFISLIDKEKEKVKNLEDLIKKNDEKTDERMRLIHLLRIKLSNDYIHIRNLKQDLEYYVDELDVVSGENNKISSIITEMNSEIEEIESKKSLLPLEFFLEKIQDVKKVKDAVSDEINKMILKRLESQCKKGNVLTEKEIQELKEKLDFGTLEMEDLEQFMVKHVAWDTSGLANTWECSTQVDPFAVYGDDKITQSNNWDHIRLVDTSSQTEIDLEKKYSKMAKKKYEEKLKTLIQELKKAEQDRQLFESKYLSNKKNFQKKGNGSEVGSMSSLMDVYLSKHPRNTSIASDSSSNSSDNQDELHGVAENNDSRNDSPTLINKLQNNVKKIAHDKIKEKKHTMPLVDSFELCTSVNNKRLMHAHSKDSMKSSLRVKGMGDEWDSINDSDSQDIENENIEVIEKKESKLNDDLAEKKVKIKTIVFQLKEIKQQTRQTTINVEKRIQAQLKSSASIKSVDINPTENQDDVDKLKEEFRDLNSEIRKIQKKLLDIRSRKKTALQTLHRSNSRADISSYRRSIRMSGKSRHLLQIGPGINNYNMGKHVAVNVVSQAKTRMNKMTSDALSIFNKFLEDVAANKTENIHKLTINNKMLIKTIYTIYENYIKKSLKKVDNDQVIVSTSLAVFTYKFLGLKNSNKKILDKKYKLLLFSVYKQANLSSVFKIFCRFLGFPGMAPLNNICLEIYLRSVYLLNKKKIKDIFKQTDDCSYRISRTYFLEIINTYLMDQYKGSNDRALINKRKEEILNVLDTLQVKEGGFVVVDFDFGMEKILDNHLQNIYSKEMMFFQASDTNGNGTIDFDEFQDLLKIWQADFYFQYKRQLFEIFSEFSTSSNEDEITKDLKTAGFQELCNKWKIFNDITFSKFKSEFDSKGIVHDLNELRNNWKTFVREELEIGALEIEDPMIIEKIHISIERINNILLGGSSQDADQLWLNYKLLERQIDFTCMNRLVTEYLLPDEYNSILNSTLNDIMNI